jgi:hypothetical protein
MRVKKLRFCIRILSRSSRELTSDVSPLLHIRQPDAVLYAPAHSYTALGDGLRGLWTCKEAV